MNYVALIEFQLPTSRYSLPIWSCKTKFNITSFVSNILTIEVILKTHFLFFNWILVSDKFRQLKLIWSNFNCQPADTVFRYDPARQISISPHLSVISWKLRCYWKYTFFLLIACSLVTNSFELRCFDRISTDSQQIQSSDLIPLDKFQYHLICQ